MTPVRLPEREQAKTYIVVFVLGMIIAFSIWGLSYVGWFRFATPSSSFPVNFVNPDEAVTLETLLEENQYIQPQGKQPSTQVKLNIIVDYWDRVCYPKDLFIFHTFITNDYTTTLWYPTILVLVMDSRDYVRGKTIIQLWGEGNGIPSGQTVTYTFHFQVPEDMQGDNVFIKAFLYGEFSPNYRGHSSVNDILQTVEDDIYGRFPYDSDKNRFLFNASEKLWAYPRISDYVFQTISIIGAVVTLFVFMLSFMGILGEKAKQFLSTDQGLLFIMIVLMILILFFVFLLSMWFY